MDDALARLPELLYLMAPAYLANMAPPFTRYWKGWNRPIHARRLGTHKTVVGFALGVAVAMLATAAQALADLPGQRLDYAHWPWLGLGFGLGAMGGDSARSWFKRRRGLPPGARWLPFDQLDFVVGTLALVGPFARLDALDVALILLVSFVGDIAVNRIAYSAGIKASPW